MKTCGESCQIFSRVTGYYSSVNNFNKGKQQEFKERASQNVKAACEHDTGHTTTIDSNLTK